MSNQGMGSYYVDIVMCIDATGSMAPIIDEVKNNAMSFHQGLSEAMEESGKYIGQLRVKVIVFRDYICDTDAMVESEFFVLPEQSADFRAFVGNIQALGGGDEPENALEALALAIKSDWTLEGQKRRHVVVMFSDASALPLGERADSARYPSDMPKSFAELAEMWEGESQLYCGNYQLAAGRLVAFVPNVEPWTALPTWNRCWPMYSDAEGLQGTSMSTVYDVLVKSFGKHSTNQ